MGAKISNIKKFGIGTCAEYDFSEGLLSLTSLVPKTLYGSTKVALYHVLKLV